jgi:hypothetical protein
MKIYYFTHNSVLLSNLVSYSEKRIEVFEKKGPSAIFGS